MYTWVFIWTYRKSVCLTYWTDGKIRCNKLQIGYPFKDVKLMNKSSETVYSIKQFVGGLRKNGTAWYWATQALDPSSYIPDIKLTTVCAFLRVKEDPRKLVIIKNA